MIGLKRPAADKVQMAVPSNRFHWYNGGGFYGSLQQLADRNSLTDMHGQAAPWRPDKRFT